MNCAIVSTYKTEAKTVYHHFNGRHGFKQTETVRKKQGKNKRVCIGDEMTWLILFTFHLLLIRLFEGNYTLA